MVCKIRESLSLKFICTTIYFNDFRNCLKSVFLNGQWRLATCHRDGKEAMVCKRTFSLDKC